MQFKAVYDALDAQHQTVLEIMGRIDAHFEAGKPDKALALADELESAKAKENEIEKLYNSMVSSSTKNLAASLVPADQKPADDETAQKTMTRAEFDTLAPQAQGAFIRNGGKVVDEEGEK